MYLIDCYTNKVVEAAGVEPASEKARHEKPTCVAASVIFGRRLRNGKNNANLVRLISVYGPGPRPLTYPVR